MSVGERITTDRKLARLLQIGVVLEEVVEARAAKHFETLSPDERAAMDPAIQDLLAEAREESAEHRGRLEDLIDDLDAETVPFEEVQTLVEGQYARTGPEDFDDILYDQFHGEESAYKFYDDLVTAIEEGDATFSVDREQVISTLAAIRDEEEAGVREVTELMEERV